METFIVFQRSNPRGPPTTLTMTLITGNIIQLVYRDTMASPIAAIVVADYRMSGADEMLVVSTGGEVRGYIPTVPSSSGDGIERLSSNARIQKSQAARNELQELQRKKASLSLELMSLEDASRNRKQGIRGTGAIPLNTEATEWHLSDNGGPLELHVSTNNDAVIVSIVVLDPEGRLFDGETLVSSPEIPSSKGVLVVSSTTSAGRLQAAKLTIQAHVGSRGYPNNLYAFELQKELPKFAMFSQVKDPATAPKPDSCVMFSLSDQHWRVGQWIERSFLCGHEVTENREIMEAFWLPPEAEGESTRTLWVQARLKARVEVRIRCDSMELAGEVVQDLGSFLEVTELESTAHFPGEMEVLRDVMEGVVGYNSLRQQLTADMADSSQRVKAYVVRAEDARLLGDMPLVRKMYAELHNLNRRLVGEYAKRANNHHALLAALKEVKQTVQKASNLRIGQAKTRVVSDCRAAIKANNADGLVQVISDGLDPLGAGVVPSTTDGQGGQSRLVPSAGRGEK
ncbi:unnamed protein product [Ectocarpus sp. 12 AP-2014]